MSLPTPRLEIYPSRIKENALSIVGLCHKHKVQVAGVTKVTCAHPSVVHALVAAGVDLLADSRIENLEAIRQMGTSLPLILTRIPTPSHAATVVELADISLNSSYETIRLLSAAAQQQKKTHKVILMVDLGDLREGVWPDHLIETVEETSDLPNIDLIGLGSNLACYGGVIPTHEKMQMLIDLRDQCRSTLGLELPFLSGGNSANLPLLASGGMPPEINQLRIGEAIQLGRNVINREPWPGTRQDTYKIIAEVIELERKPSIPIGEYGQDAFGGSPQFVDRGTRLRAICNIGRQDVNIDNLETHDPGILVLGGSSDHLILDVEEAASPIALGDEITFLPGYAALLAASTSPYVQKVVIQD